MTRRLLLIIAVTLLALALAAFAIVVAILGSERGARWSLQLAQDSLPALSIENARGDWIEGLHIDSLCWRDEDIDLSLSDVNLRLHWPSLLHNEVKLTALRVNTLRIESKGESNDDPIKLPLLVMPTTLSAPELAVQRLQIVGADSTTEFTKISADVRWRATTLRARKLQIDWSDLQLRSDGDIGFRGDYPLRLRGALTTPQLPAPVDFTTDGDLRQLVIHARIDKPYAVRSDIKLATLDKNLPLDIVAELTQPLVQPLAGGDLKVETAKLLAHGDLTHVNATLASTINEPHYGATQLSASAQWQPEQLRLDARWALSKGDLQLACTAALTQPLTAKCSGAANTIDLSAWLDNQSAEISSTIQLEGSRSDTQWMLSLQLPDVRGQINGEPIRGQLDLHTADGELWQLRKFELASGPNHIDAQGKFGAQNQLQIDIKGGDLARLQPQLGGTLNANLSISGDLPLLDLRGSWSGEKLRYDNMHVARSKAEFTLRKLGTDNSMARIDVHGIVAGTQAPIDMVFNANGNRGQQQLTLNASQREHQLHLQCNTAAAREFHEWQISCPEFSGAVRHAALNAQWRNSAPLTAHLLLETVAANATEPEKIALDTAELKPFCLRSDDAELCLDQALRYARGQLQPVAVHGNALPLRWLTTWLPQELQLENDARATLRMQLHSVAPLRADASLNIPTTHWQWQTMQGSQRAEINAIAVDAKLDAQRAQLSTAAQSPTLGGLNAQLNIIDPRNRRELDGHIHLQRIQLEGFAWLVQGLDAIRGEINGDIRIAGTASAPQLRGQLLLKDGNASWAPLGAPFRTINADLTFDNTSAKLGGWFALGQGGGDIDGTIRWEGSGEKWDLQLALIAGGLSAMPLPDSTVVFSPHINLTAQPSQMRIKGYIDIASAEIVLKQLPPETIDVSQDQRIVGQPVDPDALQVWTDLGLNLGDKFHFSGFGADVNLSGRLQIDKTPGDLLHVTGEVRVPRGRYRAYGQRLSVRRGSFIFYGPLDNPDLNLEAVREMPPGVTDVVGLRVIGSLKTPEALLFSEPSLPDSDIAYYLLTGRKPTNNSSATSQYSASGALLSLGMAGSEDRAGKLAEKFGIRDLQLGTSEDRDGNTEAEISGQLGRDLYVRYGRGLGERSNSISFQYRLTPKLMIETISGVEDALDLLYSFEVK